MEEYCSKCDSPINRGDVEIDFEDPSTESIMTLQVEAAWCDGCGAYKVWA